MARATALETAERIDLLQVMILEGEPNTCVLLLPERSGRLAGLVDMSY